MIKILLTSLFFLFFISNAYSSQEYTIISTRFNKNFSYEENYKRLDDLIKIVSKKVNDKNLIFKKNNLPKAKKDLENAILSLKEAESFYLLNEKEKSYNLLLNCFNKLRDAQLNLIPSRVAEARGLFIDADSLPRSKIEISQLILLLKESNFNIIYPEVFRRGYAMFSNNITEIDPRFDNLDFDPLIYLIEEAHNNGIEVHPWIWTFRVRSPDYGNPFLGKYSDMASLKENPKLGDRDPLFLSPADPRARNLISELLLFLAKNYDIDGLMLDYIRYDETINDDYISKQYFSSYYYDKYDEYPPETFSIGTPLYVEWQMWKENQVTKFIENLRYNLKQINEKISIGVSVFRTETEGRLIKMQDWRYWANNNLVDYVCPMLYTNNPEELNMWIDSETNHGKRNDFLYSTLGAYKFNIFEDIYSQMKILNERHVTGVNIFALAHIINKNDLLELSKSIFRNKAEIPHRKPIKSVKLIIDDLNNWLLSVKKLYPDTINNIIYEIKKNNIRSENDLINLKNKILEISKNLNYILKNEIISNIDYAIEIIKKYNKSNNEIKYNQTIPPFQILEETKIIPKYSVKKINKEIKIDAQIDNIWNNIEETKINYWHNGISRSQVESIIKMAYDNKNLYILVENIEPFMGKTKKNSRDKDSWNIFNDDSFEIYLNNYRNYIYHFAVNINNTKFDSFSANTNLNFNWESQVKLYENKWILEIKIPFEELEISPYTNTELKVNFIRNRPQEINKFLNWSVNYGKVRNISRFGDLFLQ